MSRRDAVTLLRDFFNVMMSVGSVSAIERRVSAALREPVARIQEHVNASPVKHADATSWLRAGELRSLWTIATADATFYEVLPDGCAATIKPMFGVGAGLLVSDRATVFSFWPLHRRQICWAHLLRKFVAFVEGDEAVKPFGRGLVEIVDQALHEGDIALTIKHPELVDALSYAYTQVPLRVPYGQQECAHQEICGISCEALPKNSRMPGFKLEEATIRETGSQQHCGSKGLGDAHRFPHREA